MCCTAKRPTWPNDIAKKIGPRSTGKFPHVTNNGISNSCKFCSKAKRQYRRKIWKSNRLLECYLKIAEVFDPTIEFHTPPSQSLRLAFHGTSKHRYFCGPLKPFPTIVSLLWHNYLRLIWRLPAEICCSEQLCLKGETCRFYFQSAGVYYTTPKKTGIKLFKM